MANIKFKYSNIQIFMKTKWIFIFFLSVMAFAVGFFIGKKNYENNKKADLFDNNVSNEELISHETQQPETEKSNIEIKNLVNIHDIDADILVELKYASTDNFTGMVLYEGITNAYLQPDVALMLAEAHRYLKTLDTGLRLLVYDAARPVSVQKIMWERVKDTPYHRYVAHPDRLSLHNFGAAVDLTLADSLGNPLNMGTPFDHFGRASAINDEDRLIAQGIITKQQAKNRQLLRQLMLHAGFHSISGEWWHFNACSLQEAKQRYEIWE